MKLLLAFGLLSSVLSQDSSSSTTTTTEAPTTTTTTVDVSSTTTTTVEDTNTTTTTTMSSGNSTDTTTTTTVASSGNSTDTTTTTTVAAQSSGNSTDATTTTTTTVAAQVSSGNSTDATTTTTTTVASVSDTATTTTTTVASGAGGEDTTAAGGSGGEESGNTTASSGESDQTTAAAEETVTVVAVAIVSSATLTQDFSAGTCVDNVPVIQMPKLAACLGMTNATKHALGIDSVPVCGQDGLATGQKACIKNTQDGTGVAVASGNVAYLTEIEVHTESAGCLLKCSSSRRERQLDVRGRQLSASLTVASSHQIQTDPGTVTVATLDTVASAAKTSVDNGDAFEAVQTAIASGTGLDIPAPVGATAPLTVDEVFVASTGCTTGCDTLKESVSAANMTAPVITLTPQSAGSVDVPIVSSVSSSSSTSSTSSTTSGAMGQGVAFTAFAVGAVAIFA